MTKTHIYTALLMGSRFLFIDGHSLNFTTDANTAHSKKICPQKLRQDSCLIKIPAPFDAGKILSDIGQRVYCAAVYDYLEVKMRTCRVAGSADSRYRLSCADMLSDTHGNRACEAVGISCLDSAAVVYNDAVTVAGIASAHALDSTVE